MSLGPAVPSSPHSPRSRQLGLWWKGSRDMTQALRSPYSAPAPTTRDPGGRQPLPCEQDSGRCTLGDVMLRNGRQPFKQRVALRRPELAANSGACVRALASGEGPGLKPGAIRERDAPAEPAKGDGQCQPATRRTGFRAVCEAARQEGGRVQDLGMWSQLSRDGEDPPGPSAHRASVRFQQSAAIQQSYFTMGIGRVQLGWGRVWCCQATREGACLPIPRLGSAVTVLSCGVQPDWTAWWPKLTVPLGNPARTLGGHCSRGAVCWGSRGGEAPASQQS